MKTPARRLCSSFAQCSRLILMVTLCLFAVAPVAWAQPSDTPIPRFWQTDGPVYELLITNGHTYVGGAFNYVGPDSPGGGIVSATNGVAKRGFPRLNGPVFAAAPDGLGGWYIGGAFTRVGSYVRTNLAHVRANNTVSEWAPQLNGICTVLLLHGDHLYLGGAFTRVAGITRNRLASVHPVTGDVSEWNPNASQYVTSMALNSASNALFIAGNFTVVGSSNRARLAEIRLDDATPTSWNPGASHVVSTLAVSGDTVYAGGAFTTIGGQPRNRLAALDAADGSPLVWNPNVAGGGVSNVVLGAGVIYAGGSFSSVGGLQRTGLAAIDLTTGLPNSWNPAPVGGVSTMILEDDVLYLGGAFTNIASVSRLYMAAVDATTGDPFDWAPAASNLDQGGAPTVHVLKRWGDEMLVGGTFASIGGALRNNVAAIENSSGEATAWNPNANAAVMAIAVGDGVAYLGGAFTNLGGLPRNRLAAVSTNGELTPWNPDVRGRAGAAVLDMVLSVGQQIGPGGRPAF